MGARAEEHQGHPVPPHGAAAHRLPTSSQTPLIRLSHLQPAAQNYRRKYININKNYRSPRCRSETMGSRAREHRCPRWRGSVPSCPLPRSPEEEAASRRRLKLLRGIKRCYLGREIAARYPSRQYFTLGMPCCHAWIPSQRPDMFMNSMGESDVTLGLLVNLVVLP